MRRLVMILAIVLLASAGGMRGERWYKLYDQAKDDIDHQRWESAIRKLQQAVAQNAGPGASVRGEGTKRMAYFPYFLMGKAYYHLGRYDEAASEAQAALESLPEPAVNARTAADLHDVLAQVHFYKGHLLVILIPASTKIITKPGPWIEL